MKDESSYATRESILQDCRSQRVQLGHDPALEVAQASSAANLGGVSPHRGSVGVLAARRDGNSPPRRLTTPPQPPLLTPETSDPSRYSLRREPVCWVLVFKGKYAYLKHEIGLDYVCHLLDHPNEPVSGATLFSKFHRPSAQASGLTALPLPEDGEVTEQADDATISEENLDKDTESIRAAHRAKAEELKEILRKKDASASEKALAQEQLDQINDFLDSEKRNAWDPNTRAAKRVRKSIQRLCDNLAPEEPGPEAPGPVAREFAGYIARHILGPIRRYTVPKKGANVRVARGELAGQLTFECPPGDHWSVRP